LKVVLRFSALSFSFDGLRSSVCKNVKLYKTERLDFDVDVQSTWQGIFVEIVYGSSCLYNWIDSFAVKWLDSVWALKKLYRDSYR